MKNKKQILLGVAVLLIALVLLLVKSPFKSKDMEIPMEGEKQEAKEEKMENTETNIKGSLLDILKLNKTTQCSFNTITDDTQISGTTYISGKQVRYVSEMVNNTEKTKISSNMITDGEWAYTWTSESPQGMKIKVDTLTENSEKAMEVQDDIKVDTKEKTEPKTIESFDAQVDYKCKNWIGDPKMFELPKSIEFIDFTSLLQGMNPTETAPAKGTVSGPAAPSGESAFCSSCAYITDVNDNAACKKQFNCK